MTCHDAGVDEGAEERRGFGFELGVKTKHTQEERISRQARIGAACSGLAPRKSEAKAGLRVSRHQSYDPGNALGAVRTQLPFGSPPSLSQCCRSCSKNK